jgi:hypothetical protein
MTLMGSVGQVGQLIAYGANFGKQVRRVAGYVDRILKVAEPASSPSSKLNVSSSWCSAPPFRGGPRRERKIPHLRRRQLAGTAIELCLASVERRRRSDRQSKDTKKRRRPDSAPRL